MYLHPYYEYKQYTYTCRITKNVSIKSYMDSSIYKETKMTNISQIITFIHHIICTTNL